jgi:hypothetical protein
VTLSPRLKIGPVLKSLAERLKKTIPPQFLDEKDGGPVVPPEVVQQMQQQMMSSSREPRTQDGQDHRVQEARNSCLTMPRRSVSRSEPRLVGNESDTELKAIEQDSQGSQTSSMSMIFNVPNWLMV